MKKIQRLMCAAMILALALSMLSVNAFADKNDGWISITVGDDGSTFDRKGIELELFLIATGDYGSWTMEKDFSDITVFTRDDGSASVDVTLSQIRQRISDRKVKPTKKDKTDKEGKAEFKNLERGIYFVMMTDGPAMLKVSPMLLSTPNKEGNVQIRAVAKFEYETPTPSPTPTPKPTPTQFETPTPSPTPPPTEETTPPADETTPPPADETTPPIVTETPTSTITPAQPTQTPVATPSHTPEPETTPIPRHVPQLPLRPGETLIRIDDYETALGLGNIQMHVGVCFD